MISLVLYIFFWNCDISLKYFGWNFKGVREIGYLWDILLLNNLNLFIFNGRFVLKDIESFN